MSDCKTCGHYQLFQMVTSNKPHGYGGDIPCLRCCEYVKPHSEHTGKVGKNQFQGQPERDGIGSTPWDF